MGPSGCRTLSAKIENKLDKPGQVVTLLDSFHSDFFVLYLLTKMDYFPIIVGLISSCKGNSWFLWEFTIY